MKKSGRYEACDGRFDSPAQARGFEASAALRARLAVLYHKYVSIKCRKRGNLMTRIFTDTSANLPLELVQKYKLTVLPFSYTVGDQEFTPEDSAVFDGKAFYDAMRSGADVKTAMIPLGTFMDGFRAALEAGDDVLYIGMSGGVSGTNQAAMLAANELTEDFPKQQIAVIDTYAASLGEGLLVLEAAKLLEEGVALREIVKTIAKNRNTMCQYFTVDDLEYLKRGGRISRVASVVGTVFKIKPLLTGNSEGKIILCGKCRGRKQSLLTLAERYDELVADRSGTVGIAHADAPEDAAFLEDELRKRGFTGECITVYYEPVTGAHVGPGTVALFYPGTHK